MRHLRVLAGPTPTSLVPISHIVNTEKSHSISSDYFEGNVVVNVKGFTDPNGRILDSEYFHRQDRMDITWSIQVQGRFLQHHTADDILFGNIFEKPLNLPWGSGVVLKFMSFVDPTLEHDLGSQTKPWALSPLISTMPHFSHTRLHGIHSPSRSHSHNCSSESVQHQEPLQNYRQHHVFDANDLRLPPFPPKKSIKDDLSHIHLRSRSSGSSPDFSSSSRSSSSSSLTEDVQQSNVKGRLKKVNKILLKNMRLPPMDSHSFDTHFLDIHTAQQRQALFHKASRRKEVTFGPHDLLTMDFCYGFIEFNPSLSLRLPGVSFDLTKYWDGQPVRFVCCQRKQEVGGGAGAHDNDDDPWGMVFWCVQIELAKE